jgi:hypothetical protein
MRTEVNWLCSNPRVILTIQAPLFFPLSFWVSNPRTWSVRNFYCAAAVAAPPAIVMNTSMTPECHPAGMEA